MELPNNIWLIPSSTKHFDLEGCIDKYGQIYWKQEANFKNAKIGDVGYIYCGAPIMAICYRFEVVETNLQYSRMMDVEDEFTLSGSYNSDNSDSNFLVVKITGKTKSSALSFYNLKNNGLRGSVMGAMKLSQSRYNSLLAYIIENF